MRGVPAGCEPRIDWGGTGTGWELAGGIVRIERSDRWWHLAAVPVDQVAVVDALDGTSPPVDLLADADLDVTIVHATAPLGDDAASRDATDRIVGVLVAVGIADLEHRLASSTSCPGHRPDPERPAGSVLWVAGCPTCGHTDVDSAWPRPELVNPRHWLCTTCTSTRWEPTPMEMPR